MSGEGARNEKDGAPPSPPAPEVANASAGTEPEGIVYAELVEEAPNAPHEADFFHPGEEEHLRWMEGWCKRRNSHTRKFFVNFVVVWCITSLCLTLFLLTFGVMWPVVIGSAIFSGSIAAIAIYFLLVSG